MSKPRVEMTITVSATVPQALALAAMFEMWNTLSNIGASKQVAFFVDGDGDFHPRVRVVCDPDIPNLTADIRKAARSTEHQGRNTISFDYDGIAWLLHGTGETEEP